MSALHRLSLSIALAIAVFSPASAATVSYQASLTEDQEVFPSGSPGTGTLTLVYDTYMLTLSLNLTFSGLLGTTTAAHIHAGALGTNGQIITPGLLPGLPLGVTSGSMSIVLDLATASAFSSTFLLNSGGTVTTARDALIARLDAGTSYFNLHSNLWPGGEIRGQIYRTADVSPVPVPASLSLMLAGVAGLVFLRRRA